MCRILFAGHNAVITKCIHYVNVNVMNQTFEVLFNFVVSWILNMDSLRGYSREVLKIDPTN